MPPCSTQIKARVSGDGGRRNCSKFANSVRYIRRNKKGGDLGLLVTCIAEPERFQWKKESVGDISTKSQFRRTESSLDEL